MTEPKAQAKPKLEATAAGAAKPAKAKTYHVMALKACECQMYGVRYNFKKGDILDVPPDAYKRFTHKDLPGPIVVVVVD